MQKSLKLHWVLWAGDGLAVVVLTLVGFASHGELDSAGLRMLTTFLPTLGAWLFVALPAGLMRLETAADFRQLWRVGWAAALAGPLAVLLRGLWLNRPIVLIFALVLTGTSILALLLWRAAFAAWLNRGRHG